MNFAEHKMGGVTSSIIIGVVSLVCGIDNNTIGMMVVSTFVFSLYPDTDIKSISSKVIYAMGIPFTVYVMLNSVTLGMILLLILLLPQLCKHRGFIHSLVGCVMISFLWGYLISSLEIVKCVYTFNNTEVNVIGVAACVGYITHLLLDWEFKIV